MRTKTMNEALNIIKEAIDINGDELPQESALRKRLLNFLDDWGPSEIADLFNINPIIKNDYNEYQIDEDQLNVIFLIIILNYKSDDSKLLDNLIEKDIFIRNKDHEIKTLYNKNASLEKLKREIFKLHEKIKEYSECISAIKKIDYERINEYENRLNEIKTGKIVNKYKDYIGFYTMDKGELYLYLEKMFNYIYYYPPEEAQRIIKDLKEMDLDLINIKNKLMEIEINHAERKIAKSDKVLIELIEQLDKY